MANVPQNLPINDMFTQNSNFELCYIFNFPTTMSDPLILECLRAVLAQHAKKPVLEQLLKFYDVNLSKLSNSANTTRLIQSAKHNAELHAEVPEWKQFVELYELASTCATLMRNVQTSLNKAIRTGFLENYQGLQLLKNAIDTRQLTSPTWVTSDMLISADLYGQVSGKNRVSFDKDLFKGHITEAIEFNDKLTPFREEYEACYYSIVSKYGK